MAQLADGENKGWDWPLSSGFRIAPGFGCKFESSGRLRVTLRSRSWPKTVCKNLRQGFCGASGGSCHKYNPQKYCSTNKEGEHSQATSGLINGCSLYTVMQFHSAVFTICIISIHWLLFIHHLVPIFFLMPFTVARRMTNQRTSFVKLVAPALWR